MVEPKFSEIRCFEPWNKLSEKTTGSDLLNKDQK